MGAGNLDSNQCVPGLEEGKDALFLDIDGTLIDIAPTPEAVVVPESLKLSLSRVRDRLNGALALVSGRTLPAIDELFHPLIFAAAGAHGAEVRLSPDGPVERVAPPLTAVEKAEFARIAKLDPRLRVEDKVFTLAIHYRLAPELEPVVSAMVDECVANLREGLRVMRGKAVIEIKQHGFNKGTGVRRLMGEPPFAGRRPLFFGDDVTDEDAVAVLPEFAGRGVGVGRQLPGTKWMLNAPADVRAWLDRMQN